MKYILVILGLLSSFTSYSQTNAITEEGIEVILFDDNSWTFKNKNSNENKEIRINKSSYKYGKSSTFLVKSSSIPIGIYINPTKWSFQKEGDSDTEYTFTLKGEDLYGQIINEKIEVPLENMKSIALDNFKNVAPDAEIINQEYRYVNNLKILMLHMEGKSQGVSFFFYGYYYSNENGTTQLVAYSSKPLFDSYYGDIQELLNGIVKL
jgi:hypothetical protein